VRPRETIVAVASPPGRGARGLVRASGPAVRAMARGVLGADPARRGVFRAMARVGADGACPVLAMWMDAGRSFTGEDSLEISCVGAPALLEALCLALVDAAARAGLDARLARGGEFAYRAFAAGRIGSDEAESLAARIAATSDAELDAADELARGGTGTRAAELVAMVAELLALVEAGIDFTDQEDVVAIAPGALAARAAGLADACGSLRGAQASDRARAVPLVVLAGAPNAGKSTLFNALLGRGRSVASAFAGTTRDAIVERIALGGSIEADLADLAGLDADAGGASAAMRGIHERMQAHARAALAVADVVVRCTPPGGGRAPVETRGAVIEVATMGDLGAATADSSADSPAGALVVSARTGAGIEALRDAIGRAVRSDRAMRRASLAAVLPRHDAAFARAAAGLAEVAERAGAVPAGGRLAEVEVVASLLRGALDALGEIAGPVHPDEVLGLVFSRFCIGK
jgi:tRNA modification GTPase